VSDVIVIGGGFAGLSAATALAERGVRVCVVEARPTLGGRATAFTDPETAERVDNGQHVLFGCYHDTFAFLERIGAHPLVDLQDTLTIHVVDRGGRGSMLACPPLPAPLHLVAGVMRWRALGWRDRIAVLRFGAALWPGPSPEDRAAGTVRDWLIASGQTPGLIELLWEPLAVAALNQPIGTAAAAPFREVLRRMFTMRRRDSAVGVPRVPLDELYVAPARRYLDARGGSILTGSPARIVADAATGRWFVQLRDRELRARAVVCAVPWHALPDVLPDCAPLRAIVDAARATSASPIVTVNLWFDRQVTPETFVGLPGRAMQWVFDKRRVFGDGSSHLSLVSSGADAIAGRSNQELIDLAVAEVTDAWPRARAAALQRAVVVRERRATFSLAPDAPPRPDTRTPIPWLVLAGDWIDTGLPATIESAVVSGHRAARALTSELTN
jgi:squalene-associated FAD-dependent desaturase